MYSLYTRFARQREGMMHPVRRIGYFGERSEPLSYTNFWKFKKSVQEYIIMRETAEKNIQFYENDPTGLFPTSTGLFPTSTSTGFFKLNFNRPFSNFNRLFQAQLQPAFSTFQLQPAFSTFQLQYGFLVLIIPNMAFSQCVRMISITSLSSSTYHFLHR